MPLSCDGHLEEEDWWNLVHKLPEKKYSISIKNTDFPEECSDSEEDSDDSEDVFSSDDEDDEDEEDEGDEECSFFDDDIWRFHKPSDKIYLSMKIKEKSSRKDVEKAIQLFFKKNKNLKPLHHTWNATNTNNSKQNIPFGHLFKSEIKQLSHYHDFCQKLITVRCASGHDNIKTYVCDTLISPFVRALKHVLDYNSLSKSHYDKFNMIDLKKRLDTEGLIMLQKCLNTYLDIKAKNDWTCRDFIHRLSNSTTTEENTFSFSFLVTYAKIIEHLSYGNFQKAYSLYKYFRFCVFRLHLALQGQKESDSKVKFLNYRS